MATVYLGKAEDGRTVAIKVIKDEFSLHAEFTNMFLDEAKIVSKLSHPNVVHVEELGTEGNRLFLAMELLFGQSLWHVWNACRERGVRLRYDVIAWIGARVAEGLHHAHDLELEGVAQVLVHRDVNASNIFVGFDGSVKIIDFGLAKARSRISKTAAGVVKGKLAYMSPEQAVGKPLDRRSDIFALATTLWEITTDRRLFKGKDDVDTLKRVYAAHVPDPTRIVSGYPPALWRVLQRALKKNVDDRYPDALVMARALDECATKVDAGVVAEVMAELFGEERMRQERWTAEASVEHRPAAASESTSESNNPHVDTLRPPPVAHVPDGPLAALASMPPMRVVATASALPSPLFVPAADLLPAPPTPESIKPTGALPARKKERAVDPVRPSTLATIAAAAGVIALLAAGLSAIS